MAGDERRAVDNVRLEARSISEKKWLASYVTFFAFKKKKIEMKISWGSKNTIKSPYPSHSNLH